MFATIFVSRFYGRTTGTIQHSHAIERHFWENSNMSGCIQNHWENGKLTLKLSGRKNFLIWKFCGIFRTLGLEYREQEESQIGVE